jgi:uncharacterized protein (DUF305 family)
MKRSIALAGLGSIALLLAACGTAGPPPIAPTVSTGAQPTAPPAPTIAAAIAPPAAGSPPINADFDRTFIDMMVPHHQGALEMARIAQQRADHPEIKQLAEQVLASQDKEITVMRDWRGTWYGSSETPPMSQMPMLGVMPGMANSSQGTTMNMMADVEQLRTAPEPFDLAFLNAMITHHQSAVEASRLALKDATHPEIKNIAIDIIDVQLREIGDMQKWRLNWFGGTAFVGGTPQPSTQNQTMPMGGDNTMPMGEQH